ncbi:hypothetical protein CY34DRAFT_705803 [Suillus luteus UH-Slu-Lm8-n1]|uniref:Uncharacterized protein n=1 Tax=Suillus luteus UH-Slu-Lm8-n1 TaxID=930992 RepID=A0A0D0ADJ3_9AGAM|nr:hypothetical protein CY34DRAFT_705803 [Suillus luteus UH-Slu-Lm8-n1]
MLESEAIKPEVVAVGYKRSIPCQFFKSRQLVSTCRPPSTVSIIFYSIRKGSQEDRRNLGLAPDSLGLKHRVRFCIEGLESSLDLPLSSI